MSIFQVDEVQYIQVRYPTSPRSRVSVYLAHLKSAVNLTRLTQLGMSRSPLNSPSDSEPSQPHCNSDTSLQYTHQLQTPPVLTSYGTDWSNVSLEHHHLPAGETPNLYFDHYLIAIYLGQGWVQADLQVDGTAKGRLQRQMFFDGATALVPIQHCNWACWSRQSEALTLNLKTDLLTRNAAELLAVDRVELLPYVQLYDPLILQIAAESTK